MCASVKFRLPDVEKDAYKQACASVGISMSEHLRETTRAFTNDPSTVVPESLQARARSSELKETNRQRKYAMHQANNFYEDIMGFLDKRFPPEPADVKRVYMDEYEERVRLFYDGPDEARLVAQLHHVQRTYETLHPRSDSAPTEVKASAIDLGTMIRVEDDMERVTAWVQGLVDDGVIRDHHRDEVLDGIREQSKKELQARWKEDWDESIRSDSS